MNTLIQFNDSLAHAPAGVIAMLFTIALGYILKSANFFPNNRIPAVIVPVTAILFAFVQLCSDVSAAKAHAGLYFLLNSMIGFALGFGAWLFHAQILKRWIDPKMFKDDDSKTPSPPDQPKK